MKHNSKVYVVMLHRHGEENPYFQCIFSSKKKAEKFCDEFNKGVRNPNVWADFFSEEVQ